MSGDDALLCALDQLTNAIYWCRQRGIDITAATAILEAVGDWLDDHEPARNDIAPSVGADPAELADPIAEAFGRLSHLCHHHWQDHRGPLTLTEALTEALTDWTAAAAAEHHRSRPFDTTPRPPS